MKAKNIPEDEYQWDLGLDLWVLFKGWTNLAKKTW
jgi:hypothetical protein